MTNPGDGQGVGICCHAREDIIEIECGHWTHLGTQHDECVVGDTSRRPKKSCAPTTAVNATPSGGARR